MARIFTSDEAFSTLERSKALLERLKDSASRVNEPKDGIISAKDAIAKHNIIRILKDIPVEELANEKSGLKVKPFIDANIHTYADLYTATQDDLYRIPGFSIGNSIAVKAVLENFTKSISGRVKIRLDYDKKTESDGELVLAISKYRKSLGLYDNCQALLNTEHKGILRALANIQPGLSTLKWVFTGREKKQLATDAYIYLQDILTGEFFQKATSLMDTLDAINGTTVDQAWEEFLASPIDFYNTLEEVCPGTTGELDSVYGLTEELANAIKEEVAQLEGFNGTLRRYQEWGVKYILHQEKVLLGDEMGLGKTIQAIAAMVALRNSGMTHFVVVCPASVVTNWCREIKTRSNLNYIKIHGPTKASSFKKWKKEGGVAVTTFDTTSHMPLPQGFDYHMLVVDEAHYIKNPSTRRSKNIRKLCSHTGKILFMTGTALENHVREMIELIRILRPEIAEEALPLSAMSRAPEFMGIIAPVYYRRKREDVLTELPELIENEEWCELNAEEIGAYEEAVLSQNYAALRRVSFDIPNMVHSSKMTRLLELVEMAKAENRKVIVFSFFLDTINKVKNVLGESAMGPINGSISPKARQDIVDEFNSAPAGSVLVSQIAAGGVGLNIQAASVVVICEPQFKPSSENQAISRAYRMGQARNVLVYRLLAQDTIDEKLLALVQHKQNIFDAFADNSIAAKVAEKSIAGEASESGESGEINDDTFKKLVQAEIRRIKEKKNSVKDAIGYQNNDRIQLTQDFLEMTFEHYNAIYFDGILPRIPLRAKIFSGNDLGLFSEAGPSISIADGEWIYQTYRNTMVHEMCHYYVYLTGGTWGMGDGHGKDWLAIVKKLNDNYPELDISMYGDETPTF